MSARGGIIRCLAYAGLVAIVALSVLFLGLRLPGGLQLVVVPDSRGPMVGASWVELLQYLLLINCAGISCGGRM